MDRIHRDTPERNGSVAMTEDMERSLAGADAIYTDVWVSMGEEAKLDERIALLRRYRVTADVMASSGKPTTIFMHCLPALHDLETEVARNNPDLIEVDDVVFEGPQSRVFSQSENRMHTIKALMLETIPR